MSKRKRNPTDHDPAARGRGIKKVKHLIREKLTEEVVDASKSDAKVLPHHVETKERETKGEIELESKSKGQDKKKLKSAQKIALQAQPRSEERQENATGDYGPANSQERMQQKGKGRRKGKRKELVSERTNDRIHDAVATFTEDPNKPKHNAVKPDGIDQEAVRNIDEVALSYAKKRKRKNKDVKKSDNGDTHPEKPTWKISDAVGGHMLDVDPIFSRDEQFLLVAYHTAITVYSTSTSLAVRRLIINKLDRISAFTLSSSIDSQVFISTISGAIEKWDWTEGSRLGRWKLSSSIYFLATSLQTADEDNNRFIYTVDTKDADQWLISAHRLDSGEHATMTEVKTLLRHQGPLSSLRILAGGRFVVATSGSQLVIGNTAKPNPPLLQDLSYTWRVVECPEWITCIDVRISHPERIDKPSKGGRRIIEALDIAVGGLKGSIHVYDNLLGKLIRTEQPTSKELLEDIKSRRLHWHRNAVLSLKWSLDGNYLISGGQETVLVLWQLETGRRQDIPHLGAPIESVVVSPFGASYCIGLADNSAMILSTSELTPTFSIAGIQIPSARNDSILDLPFVPTVDAPRPKNGSSQESHFPACTSSLRPGCLLLAVPPSITSRQASKALPSASYLQSFDIGAAQQTARQALTRTKVTELNMGPESNTIEEPNVTHIGTSVDGQWLATVDTWVPPKGDHEALAYNQERLAEEQTVREEIHLKFWSWKDDTSAWELVSRIDDPHASQSGHPYVHGDVLQLSSDPNSVGFATIGTDGMVKTWKPAIRHRHGVDVRDKDGKVLKSWFCKHVIALEVTNLSIQTAQPSAKLAYSQDGSILVAYLQTDVPSPLYILDTDTGDIRSIQTGLYNGTLFGLGVINKYLITLSNELCVWDLVNDELQYGIHLQQVENFSTEKRIASSHLAVDHQHGIFAIALPEMRLNDKKSSEWRSQIAIFDPTNAAPLYQTSLSNTITTLLPVAGRKGFHTIDTVAEVRTLVPNQSNPFLQLAPSKDETEPSRGLGNIFGNGQSTTSIEDGAGNNVGPLISKFETVTQASRIRDDDVVVVSQDQLAEVFDVGTAYPSVTEMFEQVASLFGGRAIS